MLAREQRVVCVFPSGRAIMLSRVAGFSSPRRRGETLGINHMAVFTQHGYLTLSSKFSFSQSCISFIYLLFTHQLFPKRIWDSCKNVPVCVCVRACGVCVCVGGGIYWKGSLKQDIGRENSDRMSLELAFPPQTPFLDKMYCLSSSLLSWPIIFQLCCTDSSGCFCSFSSLTRPLLF